MAGGLTPGHVRRDGSWVREAYVNWARGLRDARDPRGTGAGSGHGGPDDPDLPDVDIRPGGGRSPQGLRLLPQRQPDPDGARDLPRLARERRPRSRLLVGARRDD